MSAEIRDDDEGPVDREMVITNLLMHRLEEFVGQPANERTRVLVTSALAQSLKTMAMTFRIQKPAPTVDVTVSEDGNSYSLTLRDAKTGEPITVAEWLGYE